MTQHHHPLPPPDPMPLDPEERALAARLARLGPHGEPSPALDARVLAAAHAATTGRAHAAGDHRGAQEHGWRRARWPVGAGVAASVALAAAIAWQMRPLPAPVMPATESNVASPAPASAPSQRVADDATEPRAVALPMPAAESDAMAAAPSAAAPSAAATSAPLPRTQDVAAARAMAPPAQPPVVFDAPSAVEAAPPPPPAPPAPAVAAKAATATARTRSAAEAQATAAPPAQQQAAAAGADMSGADAPEGDVPPATAASPEVRDAWLARIRELAAAGRTDEARASLAEFHRRYPAFAIPEDLRPLLPPSPAP